MGQVNYSKYVEEKLKSSGYKITLQRLNILKVIYENNRHMSADEIYKEVKGKKIGLTTIYRNLMIFEEIGLIRKISITNIYYYELELVNNYKVHIHARCSRCNKIMDVNEVEVAEEYLSLIKKLNKKFKIVVQSISVMSSDSCDNCNSELKDR